MLYHPDKTDNELLKEKFAIIKEAYEVLSHPAKRRKYDLTFDNFSYRKEAFLTPLQLLEKVEAIRIKAGKMDPYRMDLDRLEFEITELLSERNTETLTKTEDQAIVQQFIDSVLATARPLSPGQFRHITERIVPFADQSTRERIKLLLQNHSRESSWNAYKILVAIAGGIILCLLIYYLSHQG